MNNYTFNNKEHLHLLNGKPLTGTSSVSNVIAKPLTWWASGLAVSELGWSKRYEEVDGKRTEIPLERRLPDAEAKLKEIKELTGEKYLELLDLAYKAHDTKKKEAGVKGTDLHAEIENWVKNEVRRDLYPYLDWNEIKYDKKIQPLVEWSRKNIKRWLWSEMFCFSEKLWVGGICDMGAEMNDGSIILMDAKSAKAAYVNMFIQPAFYDMQISENGGFTERGVPIFTLPRPITKYAIIPFGAEKIEPQIREDVENCKKAALAALELYRFLPRE